jgi:hypothetical protein
MPNFDGTGPLRRGRAIGRGLGPCEKQNKCRACGKDTGQAGPEEKSRTG